MRYTTIESLYKTYLASKTQWEILDPMGERSQSEEVRYQQLGRKIESLLEDVQKHGTKGRLLKVKVCVRNKHTLALSCSTLLFHGLNENEAIIMAKLRVTGQVYGIPEVTEIPLGENLENL